MSDFAVTLQDVANIVTFIAPGYFAIQTYGMFYAKKPRNFSQLLIESTIYSLPIVTLCNVLWEKVLNKQAPVTLHSSYAVFLLIISVLVGIGATYLRMQWPIRPLAKRLGLGSPDEDFVKVQFLRLDPNNAAVTVRLKSGVTFSGTPDRTSRYAPNARKYYYFTNIAWFGEGKRPKWKEQKGGILIESAEIEYIVTPDLRDD